MANEREKGWFSWKILLFLVREQGIYVERENERERERGDLVGEIILQLLLEVIMLLCVVHV